MRVIQKYWLTAQIDVVTVQPDDLRQPWLTTNWSRFDLIVAPVRGRTNPVLRALLQQLWAQEHPLVALSTGHASDLAGLSPLTTAIAIFEDTPWMINAGLSVIQQGGAIGKCPVRLTL